jgi:hypothetical protein
MQNTTEVFLSEENFLVKIDEYISNNNNCLCKPLWLQKAFTDLSSLYG